MPCLQVLAAWRNKSQAAPSFFGMRARMTNQGGSTSLRLFLEQEHIKAVFIDCDGTAVDSDPPIDVAVSSEVTALLQELGHSDFCHTPENNKARFRGCTFKDIFVNLAAERCVSVNPEQLENFHKAYEIRKCEVLRRGARAAPGIVDVLRHLQASGKKFAIVSSSSIAAIEACLCGAGIDKFFSPEMIFSASDSLAYFSSKPDPDIYLHAMRELGVGPAGSIALEDSGSGIGAAMAAGIPVIAYGGCLTTAEQADHRRKCLACGAALYMRHWHELLS